MNGFQAATTSFAYKKLEPVRTLEFQFALDEIVAFILSLGPPKYIQQSNMQL